MIGSPPIWLDFLAGQNVSYLEKGFIADLNGDAEIEQGLYVQAERPEIFPLITISRYI
jgi:hypothetical protein